MMFDYHIHSQYSYDSNIKADDLVLKAIDLTYKEIAFTEHLDLLPIELSPYGLPSLQQYWNFIRELQSNHPNITIHCGLEIGDYHHVREFASSLIFGYDFFPILGSVHFLSDNTNVALPLETYLNPHQVKDYYEQNLSLVSECDIDVLAHLGVYKRYYSNKPDESNVSHIIDEIFRVMIRRGISLEVNTSGFRKTYKRSIPEFDILERYYNIGGRLFSIGSDSHTLDHFGCCTDLPQFILEMSPLRRKRY